MGISPVRWMSNSKEVWIDKVVDREGVVRFAIRNGYRECFTKDGVFCHEGMPSGRDSDFIEHCRWSDFDEACKALLVAEDLTSRMV